MQISELNINLLKAFGGNNQPKSEENAETQFSDLLQIAQNDKSNADVSPVKSGKDRDIKVSTKEISSREIKPQDNRISNPQDASSNATAEKNTTKTTQKTETQTDNKENGAPVNKDGTEKVSAKKEDTQTVQNTATDSTEEVVVPTVEPMIVENIEDNALAMVVNLAVTAPIENQVSENVSEDVVAEVVAAPEDLASVPESEQKEMPQADQFKNTDDSENNLKSDVVVSEAPVNNEETISEDKGTVRTQTKKAASNDNQVKAEGVAVQESEIVEAADDTIRVQEEKIAEKLPEDTKVEIKVSVQNDAVTASKDNKVIAPEVVASDDVPEQTSTVEVLEAKPETEAVVKNEENVQTAPTAAVVENTFVRNSSSGSAEQGEISVATVTQTPTAAVFADHVVAEHVRNHEVADLKNVDSKNLTRDVAEQIKVNITQSAIKGVDKIEIQLKPAELGKIEIKMQIGRDGQLHAHITAANAETLEILQKDIGSLKDIFAGVGYQTDDNSFSFARQGEENNEREKMREFIGEVITHDVEEEMAANDYISADGVNIRV